MRGRKLCRRSCAKGDADLRQSVDIVFGLQAGMLNYKSLHNARQEALQTVT